MRTKKEFEELIYRCAKELNKQLSEESRIALEESTAIFGENSALDSLGIVMLMVSVEEHIAEDMGFSINIVDVITEADAPPFVTIGDMCFWLLEQS